VLTGSAGSEAAGELSRLAEETRAIVKAEMPHIVTDAVWQPPQDGR